MGTNKDRRELQWFHELAAVMTSTYGIETAAENLNDEVLAERIKKELDYTIEGKKYSELKRSVLKETGSHLVPIRAWQKVFKLPEEEKKEYAKDKIITPILREAGWEVDFPYTYENLSVTVFV